MNESKVIRSRTVVLPQENIDTDQIIPARFLSTTRREGLGAHAFRDWREANPTLLDDSRAEGASILIAGRNFGCGSSREHAVWALRDFGFRAVISSEIADIFGSNALENHLLPVEVDEEFHRLLLAHPFEEVEIELNPPRVRFSGAEVSFELGSYHRTLLIQGQNTLDYLLGHEEAIAAYEAKGDAD